MRKENRIKILCTFLVPVLACGLAACGRPLLEPMPEKPWEPIQETARYEEPDAVALPEEKEEITEFPAYAGEPFAVLNENIPYFTEAECTTEAFEFYSELDEMGRCGVAYANIGRELMPTEERDSIGQVKPSGWQLVKYDVVDDNYLYNRCHLIGFQLAGENANEKNLITGTRYLNVTGMLPFENQVAEYVKETGNHVLYRVTPIYEGSNLVADGVEMEALSVEDGGKGICFHVYVFNQQPGVVIDYATGDSRLATEEEVLIIENKQRDNEIQEYILNTNTMKFHYPDCSAVSDMKEKNKQKTEMSRKMILIYGYNPCGLCKP